jgi:hypothetical protein
MVCHNTKYTIMKKILGSLVLTLAVFIYSCNDGENKSGSQTADESTSGATTDTSAASSTATGGNVVSKNGLPLGGDQEVPANNSSGKGTADVSYNKETKMLTYTVTYSDLSDKASMAHIHGVAPRGTNAGVVHDLTGKLQKEKGGNFSDSVMIEGKLKEDSLLSGFYYFNIHTPKHPGGEIRGQIEF